MKKFALIFAFMIVAVAFTQAQTTASASFNLSMTVDKYIETTPSPLNWDFGTTSHQVAYGGPIESLYGAMGQWNLAYANCPFSVTVAGNNGANQGVPRFARQEVGAHGGAWDILPTLYAINFTTNGVRDLFYGTWLQGAHQFPYTKNYTEAPHNGQVKMDMVSYINSTIASEAVPVRKTLIDPTFTNIQSADAGVYECTMVVTLTAL
jgi:hypothetical protein